MNELKEMIREKLIEVLMDICSLVPDGILFDSKNMTSSFTTAELLLTDDLLTKAFEHDDDWLKELDNSVLSSLKEKIHYDGKINFMYFKPIELVVAIDVGGMKAHFIRLEDIENM